MPAGSDGVLRIGNDIPDKAYMGSESIKKVYLGSDEIWIDAVAPTLAAIGNQNVAYNGAVNISVSATGTAPITYSATGLPSGITINPSTGAITGSSTNSGSHSITVTATNAAGSASRTFSLTVGIQPPIWTTNAIAFSFRRGTPRDRALNLPQYITGDNISFSLDPTSTTTSTVRLLSNGILRYNGAVENTASYTYKVIATNAGGTATKIVSVRIN